MAEPHDLTALEQAAAIARGELTSRQLVEHQLTRVAALGATVGAFVTVTPEAALTAADAADAVPVGARGALHGVPTAIKDLTLTAGVRTTFGSAAFVDFVPPLDADVVRFMRGAGLVSLGKSSTSELGCSLYSEGLVAPPARNPWDLTCTAGGSSGGAAAAVAAGLVPIAQGSDGGGSLRIPAAMCGLVGYKPSRGLVSGGPVGFGAYGLPSNGPIGRTVADVAALLDVLSQPVPGEPYLAPLPPAGGWLAAARAAEPGRLRIGRFTAPMLADEPVHPDCVAAVDRAAALLTAVGHEVVEVSSPLTPAAWPLFEIIWYVLALVPVPPEREGRLLPLTRLLRERGAAVSAATLTATLGELQAQVRLGIRRTAGCDLLLCPTLAAPQAPVGWFTQGRDPAEDFDRQRRFSPYCAIFNVTGDPSVSLPVGVTAEGLPVGVLLSGRYGDDARLIATAAQLERCSGGWDRHPAIWRAVGSANVNTTSGVGESSA
ncbi:amidase [Micromonospora sp. WMMA1363]|uniref:amidase n=1 Tax=Micromonospora sp. WMMA1363 TaxID=3053985 RepID=UPI00259D2036|nr:amidase [Micromonospora sp. WMMA1363]MDM4720388.1 amidase [Micromonospora sp. WMMA1363]